MKRLSLLIILLTHALFLCADNIRQVDSLLHVLDQSIKEKAIYTTQKQQTISELSAQLDTTRSVADKLLKYGALFDIYKSFQMDSAYRIADERLALAQEYGDPFYIEMAQLNRAEVMIVTGMYKEALDILDSINVHKQRRELTEYIYHLYHSLYMLMAQYSFAGPEKTHYKQLEYAYKDSILSLTDTGNVTYGLVESSKLLLEGDTDNALAIALETYQNNKDDNRISAMITNTISDIYNAKGDTINAEKYLILSSVYDMRSGVKEYMSLPRLAVLLYNQDEIDRAYSYMKCSMEDAIYCKARLRTLEMSRMLPIINTTYDLKMKQEKNRLLLFLCIIIVLAVGLSITLFFINKKLKELAAARRQLKITNVHLNRVNEELNKTNQELTEANHIKEEYISYVFNMCSVYIDKLDSFRKKVNRKLKAGQSEELYKEVKSNTLVTDELREFYKSFDSIFLSIYPNFVKDFNTLLNDDEQIYPKEGELLTPELRIYALVRLGISDSVKIASFLHYSPQTVYNYRLKVRNKSRIPKEDFPKAVKALGQLDILHKTPGDKQ